MTIVRCNNGFQICYRKIISGSIYIHQESSHFFSTESNISKNFSLWVFLTFLGRLDFCFREYLCSKKKKKCRDLAKNSIHEVPNNISNPKVTGLPIYPEITQNMKQKYVKTKLNSRLMSTQKYRNIPYKLRRLLLGSVKKLSGI